MKASAFLFVGLASFCLIGLAASAKPAAEVKGVLAVLKPGQQVGLKNLGTLYEINVVENLAFSHRVKEVGPEYVVVEDIAEVTETRIPLYRVKAVTVVQTKTRP